MYLVCPALVAGGQGGTGSQRVLAEMRSARADRSQRWRLVPKAGPSFPCGSPRVPGTLCFVLSCYFTLRSHGAGGWFGSKQGH